MTPQRAGQASPELRTTLYYLTLYLSQGAAAAYGGIWFALKGLSAAEIGVINAAPVVIVLAITLLVGRIADRASDWRQVIVFGSVSSGICSIGLFFVDGFWGILIFWSLAAITLATVGPVADAATMRITRRRGSDYGFIRAWGTVGYVVPVFATGYLTGWFGPGIFIPLMVGLSLLRGAASFALPNFRAAPSDAVPRTGASRLRQVMRPWFVLPLIGWSMVYGTLAVLAGFQALLWKEQGLDPGTIGVLIALGAVAEAAMFFAFRRVGRRFPARYVILVSCAVSVFRWSAMALSPPVSVLIGLQLLHSVTYALGFLGCMNFIANWTSEDIAAEAQSFFSLLQQGTVVVALLGFGALAGTWGAYAYFASAAFAAAGGFLVWISLRLQQPKLA